jgi:hypothetical protein
MSSNAEIFIVELTKDQIADLRECLRHARLKFETYRGYPTENFRKSRLEDVDSIYVALKKAKVKTF